MQELTAGAQAGNKGKGKIIATIEARMTSTRLPGKVLMEVCGEPLLSHLVRRLKEVRLIQEIVIATTTNTEDNAIEDLAKKIGASIYRGSEHDVLGRVLEAAESAKGDIIVEITGDCPIIDIEIVDQAIRMYICNDFDYVSNAVVRSYPDGMDVQVFSTKTLRKVAMATQAPDDREHVSKYIYDNPSMFRLCHLVAPGNLEDPQLGLTLDEKKDYELIKLIMENLREKNPLFGWRDIQDLLREKPDLRMINSTVKRK